MFYLTVHGSYKFYLAHQVELSHVDEVKVPAQGVLLHYNCVRHNFLAVHHHDQAVESLLVRACLFQERKAFEE